ncbi:hypothetical protein EDB83DRAFT_2517469 [Lactarius deliciosus]|nr:hypothetical protein EDB83DRAFT_2517469 [Lactarius deliciosus]
MLELSIRREQHEQLRAMIAETREGLANLRGETQRMQADARKLGSSRRENRFQGLVASNRIQTSRLQELGTSLADVAAFMQEIELQQGFFSPRVDGRGIERLRFLAMQFERMGKTKDSGAGKEGSTASDAQHNSKAGVGEEKVINGAHSRYATNHHSGSKGPSSEASRPMEATLVNPTPAPPQAEAAGPLGHMNYDSLENILASHLSQVQDAASDENSEQNGEQALESHEVIELQAFSERKEWIVEKINLLEGMPPIDVFASLDAVRASIPAESGLPTREQLKQWLIEHDKIEKETEIFDSGELKKFKKITKAASKRNLSPEDTDIIELTLTTIYEFDKLLRLLRDRSENLDLLGTRLSWEEQRCAAVPGGLHLSMTLFLRLEGSAPTSTPTLSRRGSVASLASEASSSSSSGFSRTARFKLGEALSREAAQFAGRISSLRHGKIAAAGKALDKIIENRPVPGELLDEQDKLEEQGVDAMENVGRFVMSVVTQWRKADEFYVETMKDQASAQSLLDDVEAAQLTHPSSRQDSVFSARAGAIIKRLSSRENPCSVISGFPRPTHTLFPDQPSANNSITKVLSEELEIGLSLAARLERSALDYHAACEAVRRAEHSVTSANELSNSYVPVLHHILNGVDSSDGDGSPPDRLDKSDEEAGSVLPVAQASLLGLADINVEPGFKDRLSSAIQRLEDVRVESENTRAAMTERVNLLRDVRKIWISAGSILKDVGTIRGELDDLMEQQKWKSSTASHLPPTPESVNASLPLSSRTLENATEQVALLQANFDQDVHTGVSALPGVVGPGLRMHLVKCREGLSAILEHSRQMIRLTDNINRQALAMAAIRDETHDLQARLEDTESRFDVLAEQILDGSSLDDLEDLRLDLASDATSIQVACQTFSGQSAASRRICIARLFRHNDL